MFDSRVPSGARELDWCRRLTVDGERVVLVMTFCVDPSPVNGKGRI